MLLGDADVEEAVGNRAWNASSPVGPGMAAVSATMRESPSAAVSKAREKASV